MKDRGFKIMTITALVIAVLGLTIGYAAYATTLTISGSGTVSKTSTNWNVHFTGPIEGNNNGTSASAEGSPTLESTTIKNVKIVLTKPGDSYTYSFNVENTGLLDAQVSTTPQIGALTCAPSAKSSATQKEANDLCNALSYTITYDDDSAIESQDLLNVSDKKTVKLTLSWDQSSIVETSGSVDVSIGSTEIKYEQKTQ